jgi:hypothetical protein
MGVSQSGNLSVQLPLLCIIDYCYPSKVAGAETKDSESDDSEP